MSYFEGAGTLVLIDAVVTRNAVWADGGVGGGGGLAQGGGIGFAGATAATVIRGE